MAAVLVADDSVLMREVTRLLLENEGFEVIEAVNGLEALSLVKSKKPEVVLLDAEMPRMNGWSACEKIKADKELNNIPVLICTGRDLHDIAEVLEKSGADGCVIKPYSAARLVDAIKKALNSKK